MCVYCIIIIIIIVTNLFKIELHPRALAGMEHPLCSLSYPKFFSLSAYLASQVLSLQAFPTTLSNV